MIPIEGVGRKETDGMTVSRNRWFCVTLDRISKLEGLFLDPRRLGEVFRSGVGGRLMRGARRNPCRGHDVSCIG
jgi:hypothetical protein